MGQKILIVDDSGTIRQQLNFVLTKSGFDVVEASNGLLGLEALKADNEIKLIISDIKMPNMNGIEMVEAIRKLDGYQNFPILMLTTEGSTEQIEKAKQIGVMGWLIKPFKPDVLLNAVNKLIKQ